MADRSFVSFVPFLVLFIAHLVVLPGESAKVCAPENHDISDLKALGYWQFEVPDVQGCPSFKPPGANSSTCIFFFSICAPVPVHCPKDSGICMANKVSYDKYNKTLYSDFQDLGSTEEHFTSGANHFTLEYGEVIDLLNPMPFESTQLKFQCNKTAIWTQTQDHKAPHLVNVTYNNQSHEYVVVFNYSKACEQGGGGGESGGDEGPGDVLSVGSIMLILFFPGMFLYCVIGVLINKGAGKTGREMIPNSKFWSDLPSLISDGFSFVVAKITCSEMSTSREPYDRM